MTSFGVTVKGGTSFEEHLHVASYATSIRFVSAIWCVLYDLKILRNTLQARQNNGKVKFIHV